MKKISIDRVLFLHAHLLVDGQREYLDGALAVENGRIHTLFPQSDCLYGDYDAFRKVDMHSALLQPGYIAPCLINPDTQSLLSQGITGYYGAINTPEEMHDDPFCLGYILYGKGEEKNWQEWLKRYPRIRACIGTFSREMHHFCVAREIRVLAPENIEIFADPLCLAARLADEKAVKLFTLNPNLVAEMSLLRKATSRFSWWARPNKNGYQDLAKLTEYGYRANDLMLMSTHNVLKYFADTKERGELLRGKKADLVCVNRKREVIFCMKEGVIYR